MCGCLSYLHTPAHDCAKLKQILGIKIAVSLPGSWILHFSPNRFICRGSGGFGRGPVESGHFCQPVGRSIYAVKHVFFEHWCPEKSIRDSSSMPPRSRSRSPPRPPPTRHPTRCHQCGGELFQIDHFRDATDPEKVVGFIFTCRNPDGCQRRGIDSMQRIRIAR